MIKLKQLHYNLKFTKGFTLKQVFQILYMRLRILCLLSI